MFDGILSDIVIHLGDYRTKLDHVAANLILTSPPYNIGGNRPRQDGQRKNGRYDPKSFAGIELGYADTLPEAKYQDSQVEFLDWCAAHLKPGGIVAYNHKLRRRNKTIIHPMSWISRVSDLILADEIVWDRGSGHNHDSTMMWPQTERIFVMRRKGDDYGFQNTSDLPFRSDVWRVCREQNNSGHCAPFPLAFAKAIIQAWSAPGDLVVDPYTGSGTSALAAKDLGRRFEGAEILKKYHCMAVGRTI